MHAVFARHCRASFASLSACRSFPGLQCVIAEASTADLGAHGSGLCEQARQYSSVPQFTAAHGGPVFTAGPWPPAGTQQDYASGSTGAAPGYDGSSTSSTSSSASSDDWSSWEQHDSARHVQDALDQVQEAALAHVAQCGWSHGALVAGARDVGVSPAICGSLDKGGADLAQFFVRRCNQELADKAAAETVNLATLPVQQRLHTLLRWRLQMIQPYLDSWPSALALLAGPKAAPSSLELLNQLIDEVWHSAGDSSSDLTWYTKRAALAAIYSATELYMLTDYSAEQADTWSVLDRQLSAMLTVSESISSFMR